MSRANRRPPEMYTVYETSAQIEISPTKLFSKIKIPIYLIHIHKQAGPYRRTSPRCVPTAAYTSWMCILHIQACISYTSVYLTGVHLTGIPSSGVCCLLASANSHGPIRNPKGYPIKTSASFKNHNQISHKQVV